MPDYNIESLTLGNCRVYEGDPETAASWKRLDKHIQGEINLLLQTEQSVMSPNIANGQPLEGQVFEFAGAALLNLPLVHGVGPLARQLYPNLQAYATEGVSGVVPAGVRVPSRWLCLIPEAVETDEATHIFLRVIPATKEHLARFGNQGNRNAKANVAQFVTTYDPTQATEPLQKGLVIGKALAAELTALGWTEVPEPPDETP